MILLGSTIISTPVVSIQTGAVIAEVVRAIVDPAQLNIVAYEVKGPLITKKPAYLRVADIREISDIGAIVDSVDEIISSGDVIRIDELIGLNFDLLNMSVTDEKRKKLGKIIDYTLDIGGFVIQQLTVKRPLIKRLNDTELLIHRSQIIEINNTSVVVHSEASAPEPERSEVVGSYVNPFRKSAEPAGEQHASDAN